MTGFTLLIGNKNYSSWSLRAWLWMRHLEIDFDEKMIRLYHQDMLPSLENHFSNYKVPILIHDGLEVWDSLAILEYLSGMYPEKALPADQKAHAVMRSICAEMHSSFTSLRNELPMNCRRESGSVSISEDCQADIDRIEALWRRASEYSDNKDQWLFGSFSMADAMYAPVAIRLHRYCIGLNPEAQSYIDRLLAHPAMVEWIEASHNEPWTIEQEER